MSIGFLNLAMLLGLIAVAIPPLIHLLNRRRYEVVDWGAMQFLQISETTRKRLLIEEILLMLLRMGLIALLVFALAAPFLVGPWLGNVLSRPNRDVVLIFDGSYSMGYSGNQKTPHERAKEWAMGYVAQLAAGDSVTVMQAKQQPVVVQEATHDLEKVREKIRGLPEPRGGSDWPTAVGEALRRLQDSHRPLREIVVLTDNQRFGWADSSSMLSWEFLARRLDKTGLLRPRIWVVNVADVKAKHIRNWSLAPIEASRAVASVGQEIRFRTALQLGSEQEYSPPYRLRLVIDGGVEEKKLDFPESARAEKGRIPLSFRHKFITPGSHLVTVIVEPDPPKSERPADDSIKDELPGDNRQDFAIEVLQALPVLLVDGDMRHKVGERGTDPMLAALSPKRDRTPVVKAKVVPIQDFSATSLKSPIDPERPDSHPRVVIFCNVARFSPSQQSAIEEFLRAGGGVLVTLGERVEAEEYNRHLHRGGEGWFPARLEKIDGDDADTKEYVSPDAASFNSPALELFREAQSGGLSDARFPRWWKMQTSSRHSSAIVTALFTNKDPFLTECQYEKGKVIASAVPLDTSWRTNLTGLIAFPPFIHELVYYLAGARGADFNLEAGQPMRFHPDPDQLPNQIEIQPPEGEAETIHVPEWLKKHELPSLKDHPFIYENTRETGVYELIPDKGKKVYFVVKPDHRESDLTENSEEDRTLVAEQVPMTYESDRETVIGASKSDVKRELWWWFMLGVVVLLCAEVWLTRRIVANRT
ncbi:MAG: hypothetical protein KatS3mg105_4227 [Gemmatales bacterium]|nr:MAG: hypothetical protein KatS3mg105_4227 [Gemmatales bacterium]